MRSLFTHPGFEARVEMLLEKIISESDDFVLFDLLTFIVVLCVCVCVCVRSWRAVIFLFVVGLRTPVGLLLYKSKQVKKILL